MDATKSGAQLVSAGCFIRSESRMQLICTRLINDAMGPNGHVFIERFRLMQLRERTIRGVRVTLLGTVAGAILQMVILVSLARILTPRDYGAYAAAMILIS